MSETKVCTKCGKEKDISDFYFRKEIKRYRKTCKACWKEITKDLKYNQYPWRKHFYSARRRCNNPNTIDYKYYGGKGIKFLMTEEDIKMMWFRDKAYEMKKPSIDRKDSNNNYCLENCTFIEQSENSRRLKHFTRIILQYDLEGNFIREWQSIAEAGSHNINKSAAITNCLRKKSKSSFGSIWRYKIV